MKFQFLTENFSRSENAPPMRDYLSSVNLQLETELRSGSPRPEKISVPEVNSSSSMQDLKKPAAAPVFSSPLSQEPEGKKVAAAPVFSSPLSQEPEGRMTDLPTPSPSSSVPASPLPEGKNMEQPPRRSLRNLFWIRIRLQPLSSPVLFPDRRRRRYSIA